MRCIFVGLLHGRRHWRRRGAFGGRRRLLVEGCAHIGSAASHKRPVVGGDSVHESLANLAQLNRSGILLEARYNTHMLNGAPANATARPLMFLAERRVGKAR